MAGPTTARRTRLSLGLLTTLLALAALASPAQAVVPELLVKTPEESTTGDAAGKLNVPIAIAADPNPPGNVYVGDLNNRISVFTPWGEFVKAFGWGVVALGPDDKPKNEIEKVSVDATGGAFRLTYQDPHAGANGRDSGMIAFNATAAAVKAALEQVIYIGAGNVSVSGPAGGPWTIELLNDTDFAPPFVTESTLSGGTASVAVTTIQDGANFETCVAAKGDVCQAGNVGSAAGQFNNLESIAVGPESDLYAIEAENHRMQKFDSEGNFVLMLGYDVNKTKIEAGGASEAERNVCTVASGDACQAGKAGTGPGRLGAGTFSYVGKLAASPLDGTVFIGEGEKIQAFNPDGSFREEIELPNATESLTVDDTGTLHVAFRIGDSQEYEIRTLKPHGPAAEFTGPVIAVERLTGLLAVDAAGNTYAARVSAEGDHLVLEFDPAGKCLNCGSEGEGGKDGFDRVEGIGGIRAIATGKACGVEDLYVAHDVINTQSATGHREAYFNVFGPPPDPTLCPQPKVPPELLSQYATSVDADSATLQAEINPRFWNDTAYYLEYGTAPCSEGGCESKPAPPGALLTTKVTKAKLKTTGVVIEGLQAGTTYHYRFVTESGGGGPVIGPDRTFTTFRRELPQQSCPENEALRGGASAALPDCRAYEMVTPIDKDGGDIFPLASFTENLPATLDQSSLDGNRYSYGTFHAFGEAQAAPFTTHYIAARGEEGWASHGISPPHERLILSGGILVDTELKALSPDLCEAWLRSATEPVLAEGAVASYPNLYRRTDEECGGPGFEALTTVQPPNVKPAFYFSLELAGVSADGQATIYAARDALPGSGAPAVECDGPGRGNCNMQLYLQRSGEALPHYVCFLSSGNPAGGCRAGTSRDDGGLFHNGNFQGAISADGSRVFWSVPNGTDSRGPIYVRENPDQPQSALAHGGASGTGNLTAGSEKVTSLTAAAGTASFTAGSKEATLLSTSVGRFLAGQPVSGAAAKFPAGTTIVKVEGQTLTFSAAAGASGDFAISSRGPMPFEVGQKIAGAGIPPGTTIVEVKAGELKLSKAATATGTSVGLSASSECTEAAKACTIAVSQEAEALEGSQQSEFWAASPEGSTAIFTTTGGAYRFDVDSETTTPIAKQVLGVVGVSEDASHVYLVSKEACGGAGKAGQLNLYLYETGDSCKAGDMDFVATLDVGDQATRSGTEASIANRPRRVSPDGTHLAFMSVGSPTGYDNLDAETGEPAAEVYLYDASAEGSKGKLFCVSCNPSGARPHGRTAGAKAEGFPFAISDATPRIAAQIPGYENNLYAPRALSDDGNRLFFESFDALSLRDANGKRDVYQWEAPGTGSCEEGAPNYYESNGGCIELISSGQSGRDSRIADASADGSDVFFTTGESLVGPDFGLIDVYDARINGGFPEPSPPAPQCEGEACQNAPEAPNDPTPASESFQGAGNVKEEAASPARKPCAKGKVRRQGKCVAKHKKHARRHRRADSNRRTAR